MKNRFLKLIKISIAVILLCIAVMLLRGCDKKTLNGIVTETLKDSEKAAIVVDPSGKVKTITRKSIGKPNKVESFDGARGLRLSVDDKGEVTATARYYGFVFDPGIGWYLTSDDTRILLDAQVGFYKRHGLNVGLGLTLDGSKRIVPSLAYSYSLPWKYLSNSQLLIGIDGEKKLFLGHRVKF